MLIYLHYIHSSLIKHSKYFRGLKHVEFHSQSSSNRLLYLILSIISSKVFENAFRAVREYNNYITYYEQTSVT